MTSAVGAVAKSGGSSFQGGAAMGIQKPPPGHFSNTGAPVKGKAAPAKQAAPSRKTPPAQPAPPTQQPTATNPAPAKPSSNFTIAPSAPAVPAIVNTGAGFILGLLFWTWIALPFINNGGAKGVKDQLRAKFLNKAPDGSWLP